MLYDDLGPTVMLIWVVFLGVQSYILSQKKNESVFFFFYRFIFL